MSRLFSIIHSLPVSSIYQPNGPSSLLYANYPHSSQLHNPNYRACLPRVSIGNKHIATKAANISAPAA